MQEAGGIIVGGKDAAEQSFDSPSFGDVTPDVLQGRKFMVVRKIGNDKSSGESGRDAQKRIIKTYYDAIGDWDAA